jgi:hypothetical protein
VFIALSKSKIKHTFDEEFEGFHFYDIAFCYRNYIEDVKVGVITNVRITHKSIGQTNQQWEDNRLLFAKKYSDKLPIDITKTEENLETFIFVHSQDLIIEFEDKNSENDTILLELISKLKSIKRKLSHKQILDGIIK